ncbi:MAG: hypothetical protein WDO69_05785 [Pseudomonadota bacterium]
MPGIFRSIAALALIAVAWPCVGCSSLSSCNRAEDQIDVYGYVNADQTVFSSVDPAGTAADGGPLSGPELQVLPPYTYFPANRTVVFHVGLIDIPTDINIYLSFSPERDATVAPSAGNQSLIRRFNKEEIVLRNDTCSEFWVYLTASASSSPFHQVTDPSAEGGASGADPEDTAGASGAP